jgi:hypothetical protein
VACLSIRFATLLNRTSSGLIVTSGTQSLLQFQFEFTPSPNDPKGASDFYWALGTAMVAIGRLENHFLSAVINILGLPETAHLARRFPMAFSKRKEIWDEAFASSTVLRPMQAAAAAFVTQLDDLSEDRRVIAHGQWDVFAPDDPLRIGVTILSHKDGTKYGLEVERCELSIDQVLAITNKANELNMLLYRISKFIFAEREKIGTPPTDIHKL